MCMCDRSKHFLLCGLLLLCLSACMSDNRKPEDKAKAVLREALTALQRHDIDGYLLHVDRSTGMDDEQEAFIRRLLEQHQDWQDHVRGAVLEVETVDAEMQGDSVCTVFYQITFADSTVEVGSQKMVRAGEGWKIRNRN